MADLIINFDLGNCLLIVSSFLGSVVGIVLYRAIRAWWLRRRERQVPSKLSGVIRPTYLVVLVNEKLDDSPENWRVAYVSDGTQSKLRAEQAAIASPNWPPTCTYRIVTRTKAQRRYSASWTAWEDCQRA